MINPAQKKKIIVAAIRSAVESGNGGWINGILPAVKLALGDMSVNGDVIRNCLQSLLTVGIICRAKFDPEADDEYYVLPGTPGAR
jgi:hypothetical protein